MQKLELGVAYHGNRILNQVKADMLDIVNHNMNLVVHMFTHNDMDRHKNVMKEIFDVTKDYGLDIWVDNWGLGGPPGDKSHLLQYYRDSHQIYSNGEVDPVRVCYNSEHYVQFTKNWLETVREAGGNKIFWDEPHLSIKKDQTYACTCPRCKKLFEERYNKPMPEFATEEVKEFQSLSIGNYFSRVTKYSHDIGCENITCLMTVSQAHLRGIIDIDTIDDIGLDPYWIKISNDPYEYVYTTSKPFIDEVQAHNKKTHLWIQTFGNKAGTEDDIYLAADAAYDAGARRILAWSFRGGEACDYKADNCDVVWQVTGDAMRRLKDRHLDELRRENQKRFDIK